MLPMNMITEQMVAILREGCEGPKTPWSYFTDSGPHAGLLPTLEGLSAKEASRSIAGFSIAAHVNHVTFGLNASAAWIRGNHQPSDWNASWKISQVDEEAWRKMQVDLRSGFDNLRQAITFHALESAHSFGGAVGAIAHLAYHLGAIKQKVSALSK